MHGAFRRHHLLGRAGGLRHELLTHRFGRDPRERQRRLELRIGWAGRCHDRLDLLHQFRLPCFGPGPPALREIVAATNARAQLVQPRLNRRPPPAENPFGWTGARSWQDCRATSA